MPRCLHSWGTIHASERMEARTEENIKADGYNGDTSRSFKKDSRSFGEASFHVGQGDEEAVFVFWRECRA